MLQIISEKNLQLLAFLENSKWIKLIAAINSTSFFHEPQSLLKKLNFQEPGSSKGEVTVNLKEMGKNGAMSVST